MTAIKFRHFLVMSPSAPKTAGTAGTAPSENPWGEHKKRIRLHVLINNDNHSGSDWLYLLSAHCPALRLHHILVIQRLQSLFHSEASSQMNTDST